jgi:Na+/phosphate symporter
MDQDPHTHIYDSEKALIRTPRGHKIPDTLEAWRELAGLYATTITNNRMEMERLKRRTNNLEQKLMGCKKRLDTALWRLEQ